MIDLVVGRMASKPKDDVYVDPDFEIDAARIYISQKTDIDKNFKLPNGSMGQAEAKSGIGIKADGIRIIGREGIKLVVGTDNKNSQGGSVDSTYGIELIANISPDNDNDKVATIEPDKEAQKRILNKSLIEPMVKGVSLAFAMDQLLDKVDQLSGIMSAFVKSQMEFNAVAGTHFHVSPFFGMPTTPSAELASAAVQSSMELTQDVIIGLQKFKVNIVSYKNTHLRPWAKYNFLSKYHKLN